MIFHSRARSLCLVAGLWILSPAAANAQCLGDDNLSGPCWQPTNVQLPIFPGISLPAAGICWNACIPTPKDIAQVDFSPPAFIKCAEFGIQFTASDSSGAPVLSGFGRLNYTRTWFETDASTGTAYQVWRMLLKIDLSEASLAPSVCWNPPCLNVAGDTSFWYGYIDWAQDCVSGVFENAVVLYHACDDFVHNPFFSSRPAPGSGFHPTSYYAIVAPDTVANPFDPLSTMPARNGPLVTEAVRNVNSINPPNLCVKEERLAAANLTPFGEACLCPISLLALTPQSASNLTGAGSCPDGAGLPSSFVSLNLFNPTFGFNWFEMIGTSIGSWTAAGTYPGPEAPILEEGFFLYHDSCAAVFGVPADTLDFMYGAKTVGGYPADDVSGIVLPTNFIDLASNYSEPFVSLPLLGSVSDSDHLIYGNVF